MAELIVDHEDEEESFELGPTFEERRRAILEAGHVGDPAWVSPVYNSAHDPEWDAEREALEEPRGRHP